jgi:hypothetical protein
MALVLVVFLNRVLDIGLRGNDSTVRIDVAGELIATPDEEAHPHLQIVHLQEADSTAVQPTTVPVNAVLDDEVWSVPRPHTVTFVNPAAVAAMTMLYGSDSDLPIGFQFAPAATTAATTATP